ncbi:hypothetical protein BJX64DRAFT_265476 [Aspergillus heterothallicus]
MEAAAIVNAFEQILSFASGSAVSIASTLTDEINRQREQIKEKEEELSKVRQMLNEQEKSTDTAVRKVCETMEKERTKVKEAEAQVALAQESNAQKDVTLAESAQQIKSLQDQLRTLKAQYSQQVSNVEQASKNIDSLNRKLKEKDAEIKKLKTAEANSAKMLKEEKTKSAELEKARDSLQAKSEDILRRLQRLESFRVSPAEVEEVPMLDEFTNFWDYATTELYGVLRHDVEGAILQDNLRWEKFRGEVQKAIAPRVPLVPSNTSAAKAMRLAVILGILSREINKHIFQPNYLTSDDNQMRTILNRLAETDSAKESFCRGMLLSVDQATQRGLVESRVQAVVHKVSECSSHLLSGVRENELCQVVRNVAQRAISVWNPLQHAERRYEPDFGSSDWDPDDDWISFECPGLKTDSDERAPGDNVLTVFPRIMLVSNGGRHALTYLTQLNNTHPLYIEAEQELAHLYRSRVGRRPSASARRQSITANMKSAGGKTFLGNSKVGA